MQSHVCKDTKVGNGWSTEYSKDVKDTTLSKLLFIFSFIFHSSEASNFKQNEK